MEIICPKCGSSSKHAYFDYQTGRLICKCGHVLFVKTS